MKVTILNCSLKKSAEPSNTAALLKEMTDFFKQEGAETVTFRIADLEIPPGVKTKMGDSDDWPAIHEHITGSQIVIIGSPTWMGILSSLAQRVLERMDAMISETDDQGRPILYNRVGGVVVTGNQDGAKHVMSDIAGALVQLGLTVPGHSYTFWNKGPNASENYLDTDYGHEWSRNTGHMAAHNLLSVAKALEASPIPFHKSMKQ